MTIGKFLRALNFLKKYLTSTDLEEKEQNNLHIKMF